MDEDHVEKGDVAKQVLAPELVITVAGRTGIGNDSGGNEGEDRTRKSPEIADVKQTLCLADEHIAAEDDAPAADSDGQMVDRVGTQGGHGNQAPEIGHFANNHHKGQYIAEIDLMLQIPDGIAEAVNEINDAGCDEDRQKVGKGEVFKFNGITLAEKVAKKIQHREASLHLKKILRKL